MGEDANKILTNTEIGKDPAFKPYRELFKSGNKVRFGVPAQRTMGLEHFHNEFCIQYQVSQEDESGEWFDFRVFYREINGMIVKRWISDFNQYFCSKVIDGFKNRAPNLSVNQYEAVKPLRNQLDFLVLGIPGQFIEEVIVMFFRLLKERSA